MMDNGNMNSSEPDADSIKLFIGQIPKEISEDELREMFLGFGAIYQLNKVKDKATNEHKGIFMTQCFNIFSTFLMHVRCFC